LGTANSLQVSA